MQVLFNANHDSYAFAKSLFHEIVTRANEEMAIISSYDRITRELYHSRGEEYFADPENAEKYDIPVIDFTQPDSSAFRQNWMYMPQFRILDQADFTTNMAVFLLLFIFVAILCFAAVGVILFTRSMTLAITNAWVYEDLRKLGASGAYLRQTARGQISRVFKAPIFVGTLLIFCFYTLILYGNGEGAITPSEWAGLGTCLLVITAVSALLYGLYRLTLQRAYAQHEKIEEQPKITVTLTVAECSEFHNLGEFHEGIESVDEALAIYNRIPPERMRGIRGIGINLHTEGTESYEDVGLDILTGHTIDIEILDYVPDIKNNIQAMALIKELSEKVENVEILGTFPEPVDQAKQLAIEIDQFSYDYDTYEYKDNVGDREAQLAMLTEDISNGQADYLQDFLRDVIEDAGLEENVRKAQELSQKLSEYKPLAKVEEMEEQNYNMVDNVLNNGVGEKKQEKRTERVSIKERLSQKKAEIEQNHKGGNTMIEKESEKKTEREI